MTHTTVVITICLLVLGAARPATAQDPPTFEDIWEAQHGVGAKRALTTEQLRSTAAYLAESLRQELARSRDPKYPEWLKGKGRYLDYLAREYNAARVALGERGVRIANIEYFPEGGGGTAAGGTAGGGGGNRTEKMQRPEGGGGNSRNTRPTGRGGSSGGAAARDSARRAIAALPTVVALTAADIARCQADGKTLEACAAEAARNAAAGLGTGAVITVVMLGLQGAGYAGAAAALPPVLAATFVVGTGLLLVDLAEIAQQGIGRDRQQQRNAARVTSEGMDRLVAAYGARLAEARITSSPPSTLNASREALARIVESARAEFAAFRDANATTKQGASACQSAEMNPTRLASEAERRAADLDRTSTTTTNAIFNALADVNACSSASRIQAAKDTFSQAQRELQTLEQTARDILADLDDVEKFFAKVKLARISAGGAGRSVSRLQGFIEAARNARATLLEDLSGYEADVQRARLQHSAMFATIQNLRGAFPNPPPPHVAAGLRQMDDAYVESVATLESADRLGETRRRVDDDVSRVEGFHRLAMEEFVDNLDACRGITDDVPAPLQANLARTRSAARTAYGRARSAVQSGKAIPERADACATKTTTGPSTPPPPPPPPPRPQGLEGTQWTVTPVAMPFEIRGGQIVWLGANRPVSPPLWQVGTDRLTGTLAGRRVQLELVIAPTKTRAADGAERYVYTGFKGTCTLDLDEKTGQGTGTCTSSNYGLARGGAAIITDRPETTAPASATCRNCERRNP